MSMTQKMMEDKLWKEQFQKRLRNDEVAHVNNILTDPPLRTERIRARSIYRELLFFQYTPKEKKELWRKLGKCLSLNDIEFEVSQSGEHYIKSVSSLKLEGTSAQSLSVDCLRSFCTCLAIGKSGRLKKADLIKTLHDVSKMVKAKHTKIGLERHNKVQEYIWSENIPKDWDIPPKSGKEEQASVASYTASSTEHYDIEKYIQTENKHHDHQQEEHLSSDDASESAATDGTPHSDADDGGSGVNIPGYGNSFIVANNDANMDSNVYMEIPNHSCVSQGERMIPNRDTAKCGGGTTVYRECDSIVDIQKEREKDLTMRYLMKSLLYHQKLSGEYQGYIHTFVQLRDYHDRRSEQIKKKLDAVLQDYN